MAPLVEACYLRLQEKKTLIAELNTRVSELRLENEYQLRLKDMTYGDKIRQITEKSEQDIHSLHDDIQASWNGEAIATDGLKTLG